MNIVKSRCKAEPESKDAVTSRSWRKVCRELMNQLLCTSIEVMEGSRGLAVDNLTMYSTRSKCERENGSAEEGE